LNLVPNACVLPHHNTFGKNWAGKLRELLTGVTLLGIDERTGMLSENGKWTVYGGGKVALYQGSKVETYAPETEFKLS
jgi:cyanophycinase